MENSKKKKNDTIENLSFWRRYYPLIIVISTLAILFSYILIVEFNTSLPRQATIIYPVYTSLNLFSMIFIFIIVPVLFPGIIRIIVKRNQLSVHTFNSRGSDFLAIGLMIFIGTFACGYLFLTLFGNDSFVHKDRIIVDNQTYNLTNYIYWENFGSGHLRIYECDILGLFCSQLHSYTRPVDNDDSAELAYDEATQQLSIIVEGEVVETYQLDNQ